MLSFTVTAAVENSAASPTLPEQLPQTGKTMQQATTSMARCPNDGTLAAPGTKFCPECGAAMLQPQTANCPSCGQPTLGAKFCPNCGTKI